MALDPVDLWYYWRAVQVVALIAGIAMATDEGVRGRFAKREKAPVSIDPFPR